MFLPEGMQSAYAGLVSEKQGARVAKPYIEVAYGYLPLVWGITLSHYLLPFLGEAGNILPVPSQAFRLLKGTPRTLHALSRGSVPFTYAELQAGCICAVTAILFE